MDGPRTVLGAEMEVPEEELKGQTPSFFGRVGDGGGERGREGEGSEGATDKQIGTPCIGKSESYKG